MSRPFKQLALWLVVAFFVCLFLWARGSFADVDQLPVWDYVIVWGTNALVLLTGAVTIRRLLIGKKVGYYGIFFAVFLLTGYWLILHYGELTDLLG